MNPIKEVDYDAARPEDGNELEIPPPTDLKTKQKIRIEKHSRLMQYFEDKHLKRDLDFIDGW